MRLKNIGASPPRRSPDRPRVHRDHARTGRAIRTGHPDVAQRRLRANSATVSPILRHQATVSGSRLTSIATLTAPNWLGFNLLMFVDVPNALVLPADGRREGMVERGGSRGGRRAMAESPMVTELSHAIAGTMARAGARCRSTSSICWNTWMPSATVCSPSTSWRACHRC